MKLGSGHNTPKPTIDDRQAAIVRAVLIVGPKVSVITGFSCLTSVFWALPASSLGGLGLGHKSSPLSVTIAPLAISSERFVLVWLSLTRIY